MPLRFAEDLRDKAGQNVLRREFDEARQTVSRLEHDVNDIAADAEHVIGMMSHVTSGHIDKFYAQRNDCDNFLEGTNHH